MQECTLLYKHAAAAAEVDSLIVEAIPKGTLLPCHSLIAYCLLLFLSSSTAVVLLHLQNVHTGRF